MTIEIRAIDPKAAPGERTVETRYVCDALGGFNDCAPLVSAKDYWQGRKEAAWIGWCFQDRDVLCPHHAKVAMERAATTGARNKFLQQQKPVRV
jgi:hypothetical protein